MSKTFVEVVLELDVGDCMRLRHPERDEYKDIRIEHVDERVGAKRLTFRMAGYTARFWIVRGKHLFVTDTNDEIIFGWDYGEELEAVTTEDYIE